MYQLTPNASKRNAFCWLTYEPQIEWHATDARAKTAAMQSRQIDAQRAQGVDPLHIGGMGSAVRQDPAYPVRLALAGKARK